MKKSIFTLVFAAVALFATATPNVTITVDDVQTTSYTCSFAKNTDCTNYYICTGEPGSFDMWIGSFFGSTLEEIVCAWGINYATDTTYTWTSMNPGTQYVVYVVAISETDSTLVTDTLTTMSGGGHGTSIVTVSVTNPTLDGITTKAEPNSETMLFKDIVFETGVLDSVAFDTVVSWMQNDYYTYYETDEWVWTTLDSCTEYIFMAQGMNADSVWGPVDSVRFTTLGTPAAVENVELNSISLYPNPATEFVVVNGVELGSTVAVIDAQGRMVQEVEAVSDEVRLNVQNYVDGVYFVVVRGNATSVRKFIKQ